MTQLTLVLVEGEKDDRAVVVEVFVRKQREKPIVEPIADKVDGCIMTLPSPLALVERQTPSPKTYIIHEVRRDECPLRKSTRFEVVREVIN